MLLPLLNLTSIRSPYLIHPPVITTLSATSVLPVDLNSFLLGMEFNIAFFAKVTGENITAKHFLGISNARKKAMKAVFWNENLKQCVNVVILIKNFKKRDRQRREKERGRDREGKKGIATTEINTGIGTWRGMKGTITADRSGQTTYQDLLTHLQGVMLVKMNRGWKLLNMLRKPVNLLREWGSSRKSEMLSTLFSNGTQGSPIVIGPHQSVSMNKTQWEVMYAHGSRAADQQLISSIKHSVSNSPPAILLRSQGYYCTNHGELFYVNNSGGRKGRVIVLEDDGLNEEAGILSLELVGNASPVVERETAIWDGLNGKKPRVGLCTSNRAICVVEDCGADLREMKDSRKSPIEQLLEMICRCSVSNVVGSTFFKSLMKKIEPAEDA